MQKSKVMIK